MSKTLGFVVLLQKWKSVYHISPQNILIQIYSHDKLSFARPQIKLTFEARGVKDLHFSTGPLILQQMLLLQPNFYPAIKRFILCKSAKDYLPD